MCFKWNVSLFTFPQFRPAYHLKEHLNWPRFFQGLFFKTVYRKRKNGQLNIYCTNVNWQLQVVAAHFAINVRSSACISGLGSGCNCELRRKKTPGEQQQHELPHCCTSGKKSLVKMSVTEDWHAHEHAVHTTGVF